MKKLMVLCICALFFCNAMRAQTATNFICNDCSGNNHNAFTDLDAGKVLVLVWVMPCSNCINGALTAQTEVLSANAANPNKVIYYLLDDYANTTCATLNGWAATNGITNAIVMSNSIASMNAYGVAGMPKIVVLAGSNHTVLYNKNAPDFTATGIRDAIQAGIAMAPNALTQYQSNQNATVFPSPANQSLSIQLNQLPSTDFYLQIFDAFGNCVSNQTTFSSDKITINTESLVNGIYVLRFGDNQHHSQKVICIHH